MNVHDVFCNQKQKSNLEQMGEAVRGLTSVVNPEIVIVSEGDFSSGPDLRQQVLHLLLSPDN